jgi:hypothetical protein
MSFPDSLFTGSVQSLAGPLIDDPIVWTCVNSHSLIYHTLTNECDSVCVASQTYTLLIPALYVATGGAAIARLRG